MTIAAPHIVSKAGVVHDGPCPDADQSRPAIWTPQSVQRPVTVPQILKYGLASCRTCIDPKEWAAYLGKTVPR